MCGVNKWPSLLLDCWPSLLLHCQAKRHTIYAYAYISIRGGGRGRRGAGIERCQGEIGWRIEKCFGETERCVCSR